MNYDILEELETKLKRQTDSLNIEATPKAIIENLKQKDREVTELTEALGSKLNSLTHRLETRKKELTALAKFMERFDAKTDEVDQLEISILNILKKKLLTY